MVCTWALMQGFAYNIGTLALRKLLRALLHVPYTIAVDYAVISEYARHLATLGDRNSSK